MKKQIDLAVITPTLNEEHYIGILLDSIYNQTVLPKEIIIVDAYSTDNTIVEIKKRKKKILPQIRIYQIPKYTISRQRNLGAQMANTTHLLFLDADVNLKDVNALSNYFKDITKLKPTVALATNLPDSDHWKDQFLFKIGDYLMKLSKPIWPTAVGINMYVHKRAFEHLGGFDEEIRLAEDFELVQRVTKKGGTFLILSNPKIHSSVRRWRKYGRIRTFMVMWTSLLMIPLVGYKRNPVQKVYEFGNHDII